MNNVSTYVSQKKMQIAKKLNKKYFNFSLTASIKHNDWLITETISNKAHQRKFVTVTN